MFLGARNSIGIGVGGNVSLRNNSASSSAPPGPVAAIDLDFTTGTLDSRVTFTRASSASYFNSSGQMAIASINVPRFTYDPVTLQPQGLLLEPTSTNFLIDSQSLTSIQVVAGLVIGGTYTFSFYGNGTCQLSDAISATLTGTGVFPARRIYSFVATTATLLINPSGSVLYAQLELKPYATSWIQTLATSATRATELATITGTNFSDWYPQVAGQSGTCYSEIVLPDSLALPYVTNYVMSFTGFTTSDSIYEYLNYGSQCLGRIYQSNTSMAILPTINSSTPGDSSVKLAMAYDGLSGTAEGSYKGLTSGPSASYASVPIMANLKLGVSRTGSSVTGQFKLKRFKWYASKFSSADLATLTAP